MRYCYNIINNNIIKSGHHILNVKEIIDKRIEKYIKMSYNMTLTSLRNSSETKRTKNKLII